jgi:hypothetical protein
MTKDEALKLALEALENSVDLVVEDAYNAEQLYGNYPTRQGKVGGLKVLAEQHKQAITAIKEALAQPEQEPVAFEEWHKANYMQSLEKYGEIYKNNHVRCRHQGWLGAQSPPPQRTWVGLTDEEIQTEWVLTPQNDKAEGIWFGRRIEAKLKEKNG